MPVIYGCNQKDTDKKSKSTTLVPGTPKDSVTDQHDTSAPPMDLRAGDCTSWEYSLKLPERGWKAGETLTIKLPYYHRYYAVDFFKIKPRKPIGIDPDELIKLGFCLLDNDQASIEGLPPGIKTEVKFFQLEKLKTSISWELKEGEIIGDTTIKLKLGYPIKPRVPTLAISADVHRSKPFEISIEGKDNETLFHLEIPVNILPRPFDHFKIIAPTIVEKGKTFTVAVIAEDEFGNVVTEGIPEIVFSNKSRSIGMPGQYAMKRDDAGIHEWALKIEDTNGPLSICVATENDDRTYCSNPIVAKWYSLPDKLFWGDLHSHSGLSPDSAGTIEDLYKYAKDVSRLDFVAKSDHDMCLIHGPMGALEESQKVTEAWYQPGKLTTFHSYEYTPKASWGHRVVLYRDNPLAVFPHFFKESDTPEKLWAKLEGLRALTIPHHPLPKGQNDHHQMDWSSINHDFQRLVEIYSMWTDQAFFSRGLNTETGTNGIQEALAMGHILGLVGGSDNHAGQPGKLGGLTAVYASENTRESLFDALYQRRCYSTTGARMAVWLEINGEPMGSEIIADEPPEIKVHIIGTNPIESIEIIRYQEGEYQVVHEVSSENPEVKFQWRDLEFKSPAFYYARITQTDMHRAWTSPVWLAPRK